MAIATPRTWVVGEVVTAAYLNAEVRDQFADLIAAGTSYSPTWAGLSVLGSSVASGRVKRIGKMRDMIASLVWGTSGSLGTGTITVTLPDTAATTGGNLGWQGTGKYISTVGTAWRPLVPIIESGGTVATVFAIRQTDIGLVSPGTAGYSWASGSEMRVHLRYEAA